jgi:DegV family protein with EDD domain
MTMSIALVTDSTADIPDDLAQSYGIQVVPNIMVIEGRGVEEGIGISREEFYRRLPKLSEHPTTAAAAPGTYETLYERLLTQGASHVISIHVSSLLSGIFNAASAAAQAFEGRVKVVDSRSVTLGLGFQVLAAAEALQSGASPEQALNLLEQNHHRARVVAMLDTLEYIRRSGRVSWARARLGNLLHVKPFVEVVEGQVRSLGEARTRNKGIERLRQHLQERAPFERLALLHTNAEAESRALLDNLPHLTSRPPLVVNITTIVGVHVGPNGLGFAGLAAV